MNAFENICKAFSNCEQRSETLQACPEFHLPLGCHHAGFPDAVHVPVLSLPCCAGECVGSFACFDENKL